MTAETKSKTGNPTNTAADNLIAISVTFIELLGSGNLPVRTCPVIVHNLVVRILIGTLCTARFIHGIFAMTRLIMLVQSSPVVVLPAYESFVYSSTLVQLLILFTTHNGCRDYALSSFAKPNKISYRQNSETSYPFAPRKPACTIFQVTETPENSRDDTYPQNGKNILCKPIVHRLPAFSKKPSSLSRPVLMGIGDRYQKSYSIFARTTIYHWSEEGNFIVLTQSYDQQNLKTLLTQ